MTHTMTIKLRVDELAKAKEIPNASQLSKRAMSLGLTLHKETAFQLWKNELQKIALNTIEVLCTVLECEPGELFIRVPTPSKSRKKK